MAASPQPLSRIWEARSIAVIGASSKQSNLARRTLKNLVNLGFSGDVYPIGRSDDELFGYRVYRSILDVPGPVELAVITIPAALVPQALEECGQKGVAFASITSSGFGEYGTELAHKDRELLEIARRYGMRFIGPNAQGVVDTASGLCTVFGTVVEDRALPEGEVGLIIQSGTVKSILTRVLTWEGLGVTRIASIGNKLDVGEVDLLPSFLEHAATRSVCLYLEGIRDGRALVEMAHAASKPVILLKSNTSPASAVVSQSHSASVQNDERVVDAAARQAGLTRVTQFRDVGVMAKALSLPPMRGSHLVILSGSGGMGVMGADWAARCGFELAALPADEATAIQALQPLIKVGNPIDLGDFFDMSEILRTAERLVQLPEVDGLLLCMFDPTGDSSYYNPTARPFTVEIEALAQRYDKPVALVYSADRSVLESIRRQTRYPVFTFADEAVRGLAALRDWWAAHDQPLAPAEPPVGISDDLVRDVLHTATREGRAELDYAECFKILQAVGIQVAEPRLASTPENAAELAHQIGGPVALKLVSHDISHKTDAGGVRLGLSEDQVAEHARELLALAPGARVALQPMVAGIEIMLGARRDASFGPVVSVGLGGTLVELLDDVALRLAPVTAEAASAMLAETRADRLLAGWRGAPPGNRASVVDTLVRFGHLVGAHPEIAEIDVNPLMVLPSGTCAVDARVVLAVSNTRDR